MQMKTARITKKQIQLIKIGQKKLCINDDAYRDMLQEYFGVRSCTRLSFDQAGAMIELLKKQGFKITSRPHKAHRRKPIPRKGTNVIRMISSEEKSKINVLAVLTQWKTRESFDRWLKNKFGISTIRTAQDAYVVIEGLKKVFENRMKKAYGADWWRFEFSDPMIQEYIIRHCPANYRHPQTHIKGGQSGTYN